MSKSIGNVMDPAVVINGGPNKKQEPAYGADVIRVWAASTDYTRDVVIGPTTLAAASSTLRKVGHNCHSRASKPLCWLKFTGTLLTDCPYRRSCGTLHGLP